MTAIGAGLVGFFGAFTLGGKLTEMLSIDVQKVKVFMGEVGEGIGRFVGGMAGGVAKQLEDINPERLEALGRGI